MIAVDRFGEINNAGVLRVAEAFGVEVKGQRGGSGGHFACPSCGAAKRHSKTADRRGAVGIRRDGRGYRCFQCDASGDAVSLAARLSSGKADASAHAGIALLRACAERGLCSPLGGAHVQLPPRSFIRTPVAPIEPPKRPAVDELLSQCTSVDRDAEVSAQLRARCIDVAHVVDRRLAFALPKDAVCPSWAAFRNVPWSKSGHRLIVPMFGPTGKIESPHARTLVPPVVGIPKGLSPAGYSIGGLVFADPLARRLLETGEAPAWWTARTIIIAEGGPDFLTWSTQYGDAEGAPAVFGIISGSWTADIAARIPSGCKILCRTHADDAGRKYAAAVVATLSDRCAVYAVGVNA